MNNQNKASLIVNTPPRTTSLHFRHLILESPSISLRSFLEDDMDDVDLNDNFLNSSVTSLVSSVSTISDEENDSELEAISNTIVSTVCLYRSKEYNLSSLSIGKASIEQKPSISSKNRLSRIFSKVLRLKQKQPAASKEPSIVFDDGREDLIYYGVPVREIKSTSGIMVLSTEFKQLSLSDVKLQKPKTALVN